MVRKGRVEIIRSWRVRHRVLVRPLLDSAIVPARVHRVVPRNRLVRSTLVMVRSLGSPDVRRRVRLACNRLAHRVQAVVRVIHNFTPDESESTRTCPGVVFRPCHHAKEILSWIDELVS